MKPYLDKGIFRALKDEAMFNSVYPFVGTIQWANEADLCPDTVYLDSVKRKFADNDFKKFIFLPAAGYRDNSDGWLGNADWGDYYCNFG